MELFHERAPLLSHSLDTVLRRRGHAILKTGELPRTIFWNAATNKTLLAMGQFEFVKYFGHDPLGTYMKRFAEFSFREMVTRLMRAGETGVSIEEIRSKTGKRTDDFLQLLQLLQTVSVEEGIVRWVIHNDNIGASLEHFVAILCERELGASAVEWGVVLHDIHGGGDFDVIASLDPNLIYVECKCSAANITDGQLRETLRRNEELTPELTVLLVDTDKPLGRLVERMNGVMAEIGQSAGPFEELPSYRGVFFGNAQSYVVRSTSSILRQLRSCLRHYHASVKPTGGYSFDPMAFRTRLRPTIQIQEPPAE